jgi:ADP-ribose pyrophosphatase
MDSGPEKPNLHWELVDTRSDRQYNLFSVAINRNKSPRTGEVHEFQVINSPDWVAVIPVTKDQRMVMVRQYRHGIADLSLEPPGGLVKEGQTPEQSGREELEEETGYRAPNLELLGWMYPLPAIFTNKLYVFLADQAEPTGNKNPDETEEIETVLVPVEEVEELIRSGEVNCSVMIAALHLFLARKDRWITCRDKSP